MHVRKAPITRTRQVLHIFVGTGSVQVSSIAVFIILARLMPQVEFGTWRQLFVVQQLAQALIFSAIPMSLLRFCGSLDEDGCKATIRQHIWLTVVLCGVVLLVLELAARGIGILLGNHELAPLLRLFAPQAAATMLIALVPPTLVATSRTWLSAWFSFLSALLASLPVVSAAFLGAGLRDLVLISVLASVLTAVFAVGVMAVCTRCLSTTSVGSSPPLTEVLAFLWPLLLASGVSVLGLRVDQLIVSNRLGPAVYAIYAVGAFEVPLFGLLQSSVSSVLMPRFAALANQRNWRDIARLWRRALIRSAIIIFPIAAMLIVLAPDFVVVVFGDRFREAATVLRIYLLLAPIRIMTFGLVLRAAGHTRPDLYGAIGYLIVASVLSMAGVTIDGAPGAAMAAVISTIVLALYLARCTKTHTDGAIGPQVMYPPILLLLFAGMIALYFAAFGAIRESWGLSHVSSLVLGMFFSGGMIVIGLIWLRRPSIHQEAL